MVDTSSIQQNINESLSVGVPLTITFLGWSIEMEHLAPLYFLSVSLGIVWMLVSGIYRIHKGKKESRAHELDIKERELRIQREKLEIARLQDA